VKTFVVLLCLIATTADAAPLYLKCDGKHYTMGIHRTDEEDRSDAMQITQSIRIDGTNVWVEGGYDPVQIFHDDGDTWQFGNTVGQPLYGTLNRITGSVHIMFWDPLKRSHHGVFEGVCHKTEKLF
jgi:hypothetical protein